MNAGQRVARQTVIPDDTEAITHALQERGCVANILICFGGLGPTSDDRTVETVAAMLNTKSVEDPRSLEKMSRYLEERKRGLDSIVLKQIRYPAVAEPFLNPEGFAPGFTFNLKNCQCFCLPGVPREMQALFDSAVLPRILKAVGQTETWQTFEWRCMGIPESELQRLMDPIEAQLESGSTLGYRTDYPENHLTLYVKTNALPNLLGIRNQISEKLKPFVYSESGKTLEQAVIETLKTRHWKLAVAESCTGGTVASRLTQVAGSSEVFWGGCTCYQTEAKRILLGVDVKSSEKAVSTECSSELTRKLRTLSACEVAASITGYLGPAGGTTRDPIGTLYLSIETPQGKFENRLLLPPRERKLNQWAASAYTLKAILDQIRN